VPVSVVNVIPVTQSGETNFDSEPNVTVDPANPLQIVLTAFTPDPSALPTTGPYFFSTDGGRTWSMSSVIPGGTSTFGTKDISVRFGGSSGVLYAGILRGDSSLRLNILRKANFAGPGVMTVLIDRLNEDQPWVEAATVLGSGGVLVDRVYVASNDLSQRPTGNTASVDISQNAATAAAPAGFTTTARLETRASAVLPGGIGSQDGPSVRTALHRSGWVYAIFFGWRTFGSPNVSDVVVARDENWASGGSPFTALADPGDGLAGLRVVSGVSIAPLGTLLGTQRVGTNLTIAVDPRDRRRVYIAWCDGLATTASPYTLHLRRSDDGGQNWTPDLRTIGSAINPGLAVNNRGTVALLYQQLVSVGGTNRWRTHLERSIDHFATVATDNTLADVLDTSSGASITVIIGDYDNVIAIGKDFYGAFSAHNLPNNTNFPSGVTYQRNANFTTQQLLANDNVTPVATSVDPFFFHWPTVELKDDFYVRDWTDSPTSGDDGVEPSIKPAFYVTPDVWNRRGTLPGSFPNDQPENEDAGNGVGNVGDNWLFARIHRRAAAPSGAPSVTVTTHFLVSKLGTGSNFADAASADPDVSFPDPDPTVVFAAGDVGPKTTDPFHWHLNPVGGSHLCAAVEISTSGDPFIPPSLRGRAPGWPDTDLEIVDDNNKAQRNMGLSTTAARGVGAALELYGIIHNAANYRRDVLIRYTVPPATRERVKQVSLNVVGDKSVRARADGTVVLEGMRPGENRWIGIRLVPPQGQPGDIYAVFFDEIHNDVAINGFGLGVQLGTARDALRHTLERYRSVLTRAAVEWGLDNLEKEADRVRKALRRFPPRARAESWLAEISDEWELIEEVLDHALASGDPFQIRRGAAAAKREVSGGPAADALVTLLTLLERVDSQITMEQLARGDRADILQNVRWQADVLTNSTELADHEPSRRIVERCQRFIAEWERRERSEDDFVPFIGRVRPLLEQLAERLQDDAFARAVEALSGVRDPAAVQRAHREALVHLEDLVEAGNHR
jgi:hypothetical protein